jgi:hypothetical protein
MTIVAEVENGLIPVWWIKSSARWDCYNAPIKRQRSVFSINVALN